VLTAPIELPAWIFAPDAGERLSEPVALGPADAEIRLAVDRELMRLIEDHEVIRHHGRVPQAREHSVPGERIHADDEEVAVGTDKRVLESRLAAGDDAKRQTEERVHLSLPVPHQPSRRDDEYPAE
jgi:hypothetical protein